MAGWDGRIPHRVTSGGWCAVRSKFHPMTLATPLRRFAAVAIAAAVAVIALKVGAWWITGSVGLLSDAVESLANLAGAVVAYLMLVVADRPPDDEHAYGHSKAEYFASGFEGGLIVVAAIGVGWVAVSRLMAPQALEWVALGLAAAGVATVINYWVARVLLEAGRAHGSITLESSGHHLMTDVWTSAGVIAGVGAAAITGWRWLDPVIALAVAVHIMATGARLVRRSALGLLDTALPETEMELVRGVLAAHEARGIQFHAVRSRRAGRRAFVSMHVLVPGGWTVQRAHDLAEEVEAEIQTRIPGCTVFTHLEPAEDPASLRDQRIRPPG
jgi:cation diffusion facilitator family transporter